MKHLGCSNCGYDMTGIEQFSNGMDAMFYTGGVFPFEMTNVLNSSYSPYLTCPNCGQTTTWEKGRR